MTLPTPLISNSKDRLRGEPVFSGTPVPVRALIDYKRSSVRGCLTRIYSKRDPSASAVAGYLWLSSEGGGQSRASQGKRSQSAEPSLLPPGYTPSKPPPGGPRYRGSDPFRSDQEPRLAPALGEAHFWRAGRDAPGGGREDPRPPRARRSSLTWLSRRAWCMSGVRLAKPPGGRSAPPRGQMG